MSSLQSTERSKCLTLSFKAPYSWSQCVFPVSHCPPMWVSGSSPSCIIIVSWTVLAFTSPSLLPWLIVPHDRSWTDCALGMVLNHCGSMSHFKRSVSGMNCITMLRLSRLLLGTDSLWPETIKKNRTLSSKTTSLLVLKLTAASGYLVNRMRYACDRGSWRLWKNLHGTRTFLMAGLCLTVPGV